MQEQDLIGVRQDNLILPAHAAATATEVIPVWKAPYPCRLRKVRVTSGVVITGTATNYTNLNVQTVTAAGVATEKANKDYASGVNEAAHVTTDLYAPAGGQVLAVNDSVAIEIEKVGSGLALPSVLITIEFDRALTS